MPKIPKTFRKTAYNTCRKCKKSVWMMQIIRCFRFDSTDQHLDLGKMESWPADSIKIEYRCEYCNAKATIIQASKFEAQRVPKDSLQERVG